MKTQSVYKNAIIVIGVILFSLSSSAQENNETLTPAINKSTYRTAFGLRAGITSGLTIKHFVTNAGAIEGIVGVWPNSFTITALYEHHVNAGHRDYPCILVVVLTLLLELAEFITMKMAAEEIFIAQEMLV
jgi:hypothetical protein